MPPKGSKRHYRVTRMFAAQLDGGGRAVVNNDNASKLVPLMADSERQKHLDSGALVEFYVEPGQGDPTPAEARAKATTKSEEE